jgi:SRSO17 transposase
MTDAQLGQCRKRLERFLVDLLEPVGRSERRHWGSVYVRGLLLDGERKSIEPMAQRLPDGNEQAMQQFVGQSPWDWTPVWERLARRMVRELEPEAVWVIDDTGFPKQGAHSVGVERQYSGTLGKIANCQVAVSLHEVCTEGAAVLNWRLYLPESWSENPRRRAEAGIPEEVKFRKKWELALEMIDQVRGWGLADRIVVADAGYGEATAFRQALEARQLPYTVGVPSSTGVWTEPPQPRQLKPKRTGRPPSALHYGEQRPVSVQEAARQARGWKKIRWREGSKGWLKSRFWAGRVQTSHGFQAGREPGKEVWLLVEWPEEAPQPTRYFLCDLPSHYSLRRLVRVAKARWKIEQDYEQLKGELGLDHYEGRGWNGWHHHVTLVMLAHSFLTLETLRNKKNFWLDPAEDAS